MSMGISRGMSEGNVQGNVRGVNIQEECQRENAQGNVWIGRRCGQACFVVVSDSLYVTSYTNTQFALRIFLCQGNRNELLKCKRCPI